MPRSVFVAGCVRASPAARPVISACAAETVTPSLSLPNSRSDRPPRSSSLLASDSGTHISARVCQKGANRKPRRHHADDDVRLAIERDRATDDGRVAGEPALPQRMAQHHDAIAAGLVVALHERRGRRAVGRPADRRDRPRPAARSRAPAAPLRRAWRPTPAPRSIARTTARCGGSRDSRPATRGHSPSDRAAPRPDDRSSCKATVEAGPHRQR